MNKHKKVTFVNASRGDEYPLRRLATLVRTSRWFYFIGKHIDWVNSVYASKIKTPLNLPVQTQWVGFSNASGRLEGFKTKEEAEETIWAYIAWRDANKPSEAEVESRKGRPRAMRQAVETIQCGRLKKYSKICPPEYPCYNKQNNMCSNDMNHRVHPMRTPKKPCIVS